MFLPLFCFGAMVTNSLEGGRFGDKLLGYLHAKWISFKYKIPIIYKPFLFSDQLALHHLESQGDREKLSEKNFTTEEEFERNVNGSSLYVIPYFGENLVEFRDNKHWIYFDVGWNHPQFKREIKQLVCPIKNGTDSLGSCGLKNSNSLSVAVHVRVGTGYDFPSDATKLFIDNLVVTPVGLPTKFPPLPFYIEQLKNLSLLLGNPPLYVFIFTDVPDPEHIITKIRSELKDFNNMQFDYRAKDNNHDKNVLDDFFALTRFDCLIRPQSNFSLLAAKLADYLIEIYPVDFVYQDKVPVIHKIAIKTQYDNFSEQLRALNKLNRAQESQKHRLVNRESAYPFVSGDSFRSIADHLFDETSKSLDPKDIKQGDIIFLKTDYMEEFFVSIHPKIKNKYILITHNSDLAAPGKFKRFLNDKKIIKWFGQNPTVINHHKFIPIPIGIANRYLQHGQPKTFIDVLNNPESERNILLGMNFDFTTKKRVPIYDFFSSLNFCKNISTKDHSLYLLNMTKTKFVLSPPGNGLDCHRTWEVLLMGAIPIVEKSNLDPLLKDLPVIIIEDWKEISEEFLNQKYKEYMRTKFDYKKLLFDCWSDLINSYKKNK